MPARSTESEQKRAMTVLSRDSSAPVLDLLYLSGAPCKRHVRMVETPSGIQGTR